MFRSSKYISITLSRLTCLIPSRSSACSLRSDLVSVWGVLLASIRLRSHRIIRNTIPKINTITYKYTKSC